MVWWCRMCGMSQTASGTPYCDSVTECNGVQWLAYHHSEVASFTLEGGCINAKLASQAYRDGCFFDALSYICDMVV